MTNRQQQNGIDVKVARLEVRVDDLELLPSRVRKLELKNATAANDSKWILWLGTGIIAGAINVITLLLTR